MKKLLLLLTVALPCMAAETNLQIRVDVPDAIVEQAKIYMWMIGETNVTARQWLSSNLVVALPPKVVESVNTRKQDMIRQIQDATLNLIKKVAVEFGY